jgi:uncharacterized protein (DUF1697 family)
LTCVALLRGINVGRGKRLAMADLRALAVGLGWRNVSTVLAAGTLVFTLPRGTTAQAAVKLRKVLIEELNLDTGVVVLSAAEVRTVIDEMPFGAEASNHSRLLAGAYIDATARQRLAPLTTQDWTPGVLALGTHAVYYWCPDGILDSPLGEAIARAAKNGQTSRNWATWGKILAQVESPMERSL